MELVETYTKMTTSLPWALIIGSLDSKPRGHMIMELSWQLSMGHSGYLTWPLGYGHTVMVDIFSPMKQALAFTWFWGPWMGVNLGPHPSSKSTLPVSYIPSPQGKLSNWEDIYIYFMCKKEQVCSFCSIEQKLAPGIAPIYKTKYVLQFSTG